MTLEDLLDSHPAPIRALALDLRALVLETLPGLQEKVYPGWHALGFRDPEAGYLCAIFPFDDRVQLVFEHGARLPDTRGLLEGTSLKQVRYITTVPDGSRDAEGMAELLVAALHRGRSRASLRG
jgi:hypothetical protein